MVCYNVLLVPEIFENYLLLLFCLACVGVF